VDFLDEGAIGGVTRSRTSASLRIQRPHRGRGSSERDRWGGAAGRLEPHASMSGMRRAHAAVRTRIRRPWDQPSKADHNEPPALGQLTSQMGTRLGATPLPRDFLSKERHGGWCAGKNAARIFRGRVPT